jgi:hypothetical protein
MKMFVVRSRHPLILRHTVSRIFNVAILLLLVFVVTGCAGRRGKKLHEWNESVLLDPGESAAVQVYADYGHVSVFNRGPGVLAMRCPSVGENVSERYLIEPDGFHELRIATVRSIGFNNESTGMRVLFYIDVKAKDMIVMTSGAMGNATLGDIPERSIYDDPIPSEEEKAQSERSIFDETWDFLESLNPF